MIGAVVGVQPFGGHGLSGTGPKAGGPLYVRRLLAQRPPLAPSSLAGELPGPVGERNAYALRPKGAMLCVAREWTAQGPAGTGAGDRQSCAAAEKSDRDVAAVLFTGAAKTCALDRRLAERPGPIVAVHVEPYPCDLLLDEVSLSVNTAAAGGNASLMAIG